MRFSAAMVLMAAFTFFDETMAFTDDRVVRKLKEQSLSACMDEAYDLSLLVVESHLFLVAEPQGKNKEACQDTLYFNDNRGNREHGTHTDAPTHDMVSLERSYLLKNLVLAEAAADVVVPADYDIVINNCATFVLSMAKHLDIRVEKHMLDYVVAELSKNSKVADKVKESPFVQVLLFGASIGDFSTYQLMERLVKFFVDTHNPN